MENTMQAWQQWWRPQDSQDTLVVDSVNEWAEWQAHAWQQMLDHWQHWWGLTWLSLPALGWPPAGVVVPPAHADNLRASSPTAAAQGSVGPGTAATVLQKPAARHIAPRQSLRPHPHRPTRKARAG